MQSTLMSMAAVALFGSLAAQAAERGEVFGQGGAPGEQQGNGTREEKSTLAQVETKRLRYAAYYKDAKERCTLYSGRARDICVGEAQMKYIE